MASGGEFDGATTIRVSKDDGKYIEALTATVSYLHGVHVTKADVIKRVLDIFDGVLSSISQDDREEFLTASFPLTLAQSEKSIASIAQRFYDDKFNLANELGIARNDDVYVFNPKHRL